jgi:hypothetical protein
MIDRTIIEKVVQRRDNGERVNRKRDNRVEAERKGINRESDTRERDNIERGKDRKRQYREIVEVVIIKVI